MIPSRFDEKLMRFERGLLIGWIAFCAVMFSLTIAVFVASAIHVWGVS